MEYERKVEEAMRYADEMVRVKERDLNQFHRDRELKSAGDYGERHFLQEHRNHENRRPDRNRASKLDPIVSDPRFTGNHMYNNQYN